MTRRVLGLAACGALAFSMTACDTGGDETPADADLVAGKQLFVEKCGACHVLARAETKGVAGPDLDAAFQQALADGFGRGGIRGIVGYQIGYPAREIAPDEPAYMPADLVTGPDVKNVAAYVAYAAAREGEDTGFLATAVKRAGSDEPIEAENGTLAIPADPSGQLAYTSTRANASPGPLKIDSENPSSIPHNIAISGPGANEIGPVVNQGGTSTVNVTVQPGEYDYFCTVEGHREGGMEGVLTVE